MVAVSTGRRIRGEGETPEAEWQDWLATLQPAALAPRELPRATQRLVVVSPHPDDEVLACGGLIAMHAARGGATTIVAVTDGEASHRGDARWPPERLAEARRHERDRGLARLGLPAGTVTRLALPDSGVDAQGEVLEQALRAVLKPGDSVVATWRLDGHPDHDATGAAAARVCAALGCRLLEAPVWMWHWSAPGDARVPWHRLRARRLAPEQRARKSAALAEHSSQIEPRAHDAPVLGPAILARAARLDEYFLV